MLVGVLGEAEVRLGPDRVDLSSRRLRQIVAALALSPGRPLSYDALVDLMWGDDPPEGLPGTLHAYVAVLRKRLEPDRAPRTPATVLVTTPGGYVLHVAEDELDARVLDRTVTSVDRLLSGGDPLVPPALGAARLRAACADLEGALALWRGEPYADVSGDLVTAARARLDEARVLAEQHRATLRLALGGHAEVVGELDRLTAEHPLRERLWTLRALALLAGGRQAEALDCLRVFTDRLSEELAIEPTDVLRDLQVRILRQDRSIVWGTPPDGPTATPPVTPSGARPTSGPPSAAPPPGGGAGPSPEPVGTTLPPWPLAGREPELRSLEELLGRAASGTTCYAAVTGEPGIGKSRLCAEVVAQARARGFSVLVGRCSQDDGAPPLWPWHQVLRTLGEELPLEAPEDEGAAFRTYEAIVRRVVATSTTAPVLLVLEDLHWADAPTLRVLRQLTEIVHDRPVLVAATWRLHPPPAGALADAADALARAHAARLALTGLGPDDAASLVRSLVPGDPSPDDVTALAGRADGNPFFLVELARLAHTEDDVRLLRRQAPHAVRDVVDHRIGQLPGAVVATLRRAAVVGRTFDLPSLLATGSAAEDDLVDHLDTATASGLLTEEGPGLWSFHHALVRDAAYDGLGVTRAAMVHARVAAFLDDLGSRQTEAARHWMAAGPPHRARAWRSAAQAAHVARGRHDHEDAVRLLRAALETMGEDPGAQEHDRFRLLLDLGEAERWSGQWDRLRAASEEALTIAERAGDVHGVTEAASAMTRGAFWQTTSYRQVHHRHVDALRRVLRSVPAHDDPERCLLLASLALETYYSADHAERVALVEESQAMAERLGDDHLLVDTLLMGSIAIWRHDTAARRLAMTERAADLSECAGDADRAVVARTLRTVALGELGRVEEMWRAEATARAEAERLRLPYGVVVLDSVVVPWHAMAGRAEEAAVALAGMDAASKRLVLFQSEEAVLGAALALQLWCGDVTGLVEPLVDLSTRSPLPSAALVTQAMVRAGDPDRARRRLVDHPVVLPATDDWFTPLALAAAAETALWVGDPDLGSRCYHRLAPAAGMSVSAGSGVAQGPVDAFLALAAGSVGERETASRHADDAAALMVRWDIPRCGAWFAGLRDRFDF